jgi:Putative DNA-binding domain
MDLHLHTPASSDYQEPSASYLDILLRAEARGLDLIGFTDHNTVAGYRTMRADIEELELLERLKRLLPEEKNRLAEYRRLMEKILVLPGFEFTATFGFHIIGLFSPSTPLRDIEHILLSLNIPSDQLDRGSSTVGATEDVLTAYRLIDEGGGLVIAAHANSSNGVAMRGFNFGGQTKIAYTQDKHLHAIEVTDLDQKGRRTSAAFFNGSKPEYPRRMHCIQGSDSHRLRRDPSNIKNLGVGERTTEVMLETVSFESLKELFFGNDFSRARPYTGVSRETELDYVQTAREEGPSIVQSFHAGLGTKDNKLDDILADVCAFANTNGGTLYIGVSIEGKQPIVGVLNPQSVVDKLQAEISRRITPDLAVTVDTTESRGKKIVRALVPRGDDPPYAIDQNKIYLRQEAETSPAVRDEIVQLVLRTHHPKVAETSVEAAVADLPATTAFEPSSTEVAPPRTGVEVVATENRKGTLYHTVRDLRNGNVVKNVTRSSARHLWRYAITEAEAKNPASITWHGDLGFVKKHQKVGTTRFDLAQRTPEGTRIYYGVTEDGVHGDWKQLVGSEDENGQ